MRDLAPKLWLEPGVLPRATDEDIEELAWALGAVRVEKLEWPNLPTISSSLDPYDLVAGSRWPIRATLLPGSVRTHLFNYAARMTDLEGDRERVYKSWLVNLSAMISGSTLWEDNPETKLQLLARAYGGSLFIIWSEDALGVTKLPNEAHFMTNDALVRWGLHSVEGPAVRTPDEDYYFIEGLQAAEWMVTGNCSAKDILGIPNVDLRRAVIQHLGIERVLTDESRIDEAVVITGDGNMHPYELHQITLPGTGSWMQPVIARYLKMTNPSIGGVHVEGVPETTDSVASALAWRNRTRDVPEWLS